MDTSFNCRILSADDMKQIVELKQMAFGMPISKFRDVEFEVSENYGLFDSGKLVGMVAMTPKDLTIGNCCIKVGGIGAVSTHPEARGKGVMRKLLDYSVERMRELDIPLSILWGDTQRYRHFGWETCGRKIHFRINGRSMKYHDLKSDFVLEPYNKSKHLDAIMAMHDAQTLRVKRSRKDFEYYLGKPSVMTWFASQNGKNAYLVQEGEYVIEYAGDFSLVCQGLKFLLANYERSELTIQTKNMDLPEQRELYKMSAWWTVEPLAMLKIIDLEKTLRALGVQIKNDHAFSLKMLNSNQTANINCTDNSANCIELSDIEMTRLIFNGNVTLEQAELNQIIKQFFPLDMYWPRLDAV